MSKDDKRDIAILIFIATIAFFVGWVLTEISLKVDVRSGKNFIMHDASYRCIKTNELKRGE